MSGDERARLDPRAWLLWGVTAGLPPLLGRNPFVLLATLLVVLGIRAAWGDVAGRGVWSGLVRLAVVILAIGVAFNLLTVHVGDRVLARLPDAVPVVGGPLTVNALVYGVLGAAATLTLVLIGLTLGATLDWAAVLRLLPDRMLALAVIGSIAWGLVPQTVAAVREIHEAQTARGFRPRGLRDAAPATLLILVPLLDGGLERAWTLAEALEARGFGAPAVDAAEPGPARLALTAGSLAAGVAGGYLLAAGSVAVAAACLAGCGLGTWLVWRDPPRAAGRVGRTRYREPVWGRADTAVALPAAAALGVLIAVLVVDPTAFAYEPYPILTLPPVNLALVGSVALLLVPAWVRT